MNKILSKILLILLLFLSISNVYAREPLYTNETTNYEVVIEDDSNLLTETEKENLIKDMQPLTNFGNIIFKSINNTTTSTSNFAADYYHENFGTQSGTLFLIDMYHREIYVFSDGDNYKVITRSKALSITDNIYKLASEQKYYECAKKAYEQINTLLNNGKIAEPMRYISYFFIAIILSFFSTFLFVLSKSKIKAKTNYKSLNKYNVRFNIGNITGIKTGEKRVYNPPSSSSSGGSSGGGGGSSGGGGGHSF